MSLKEQLNSYTEQPDAELYSRIEKTLRRRRLARRGAVIAPAAAAAVVGLVLVLRPVPQVELAQAEHPQAEVVQTTIPAPVAADEPQAPSPADQGPAQAAPTPREEARPSSPTPQPATPSQMTALPQSVAPKAVATRQNARLPEPARPAAQSRPAEAQPAAQEPKAEELAAVTVAAPAAAPQQSPLPAKSPIIVDPNEVPELLIPNVFSPDGPEEVNRKFRIVLREGFEIKDFRIYIFNRGGRQVFYSTSIDHPWDGTARGVAQPMGGYVYKLEYRNADGNIKVVAGSLTLIR